MNCSASARDLQTLSAARQLDKKTKVWKEERGQGRRTGENANLARSILSGVARYPLNEPATVGDAVCIGAGGLVRDAVRCLAIPGGALDFDTNFEPVTLWVGRVSSFVDGLSTLARVRC